jgi:hypothetical protein
MSESTTGWALQDCLGCSDPGMTTLEMFSGKAPSLTPLDSARVPQVDHHPGDSLGDSTNDVDRTDLDTDRRLRRHKFILVGASVQMAWKRSPVSCLLRTQGLLSLKIEQRHASWPARPGPGRTK